MSRDWKGTLPMDMFAALFEDGFDVRTLTGGFKRARPALRGHIKRGHPALALSVVGAYHWVAITGMDDGGVWVADSSGYLYPEKRCRLRCRITDERAGGQLNGFVLTERGKRTRGRDMTGADFARQFRDGADFSARCLGTGFLKKMPSLIGRLLPD